MTSIQSAARNGLDEIKRVREKIGVNKYLFGRKPINSEFLDALEQIYTKVMEDKPEEAAEILALQKKREIVYLIPKELYKYIKSYTTVTKK